MDIPFSVERVRFPAGEGQGTVANKTHFLTLADSPATFVEWRADDTRHRTRRSHVLSGEMWVWPQGYSWWLHRESSKTCILLSLSTDWLSQATHSSADLLPATQLRDPLLAQMLRTLTDTAETLPPNPTTQLYRESLATTLALHLVTHCTQADEAQASAPWSSGAMPLSTVRFRVLSDYIAAHLSDTISLAALAELAGLSTSQFSLRFRETTGQTPYQFVTALRVDRARELLIAGRHTPAEVAVLTGFSDQSHLTRHLRRRLGVTPGALQKQ